MSGEGFTNKHFGSRWGFFCWVFCCSPRGRGFAFVYNQYYCAPVEQELKFTCSSACSWFRWWPSDHRAGTCYDHLIFPQGRSEYFLLHVKLQCQPKLSQCFSQPTQVPHHHWLQHRKLYKAGCNPIQVKPLCGWRCQSQTCHDKTPSRFARHRQTAAAQCCGGNYEKGKSGEGGKSKIFSTLRLIIDRLGLISTWRQCQ